jgi:hypothetical protein
MVLVIISAFQVLIDPPWANSALDESLALKSTVGNRIGRMADPWQTSHY